MASTTPLDRAVGSGSISQPPTGAENPSDRAFRALAMLGAAGIVVLLVAILWEIGGKAVPAIGAHGLGFLVRGVWDVGTDEFGILPEIWGTLYSSLLALLIGGFFGVAVAIFLTQDFLPPRLAAVFRTIIELLAAIPSVVYGLWGIFVVIPAMRPVADWLHEHLGWIPFFGTSLSGPGMLPAALVLAIMILPTVAAISQDALRQVPYKVKEAAYGMGTTRWEAILQVHAADRRRRHLRRARAGLRPRARRDDGARHADRQLEPDQPVAVLAGQHAGGAAGAQLPRGRRRGSRRR